jgi:hypothetical protein
MSAASVATTALQHRLNPVSVHRWIREAKQKQPSNDAAFVPFRLDLGAGIDAIMLATVGPDPFDLQASQSAAQSELETAQFIGMHEVETCHVPAERL